MKKICVLAALAIAGTVQADGWAIFDGGWHLSAGGVYASPVKANLRFSPVRIPVPSFGRTAAEARALAEGNIVQFTKDSPNADVVFPNGARINPWDDARTLQEIMNPGGNHFGQTCNAWFPVDSLHDNGFALASYEYAELSKDYSLREVGGSDERGMPGVNVELARNLYHDEEYKYGVDLAFAVSYFFSTDVFSMDRQYASGSVDEGVYETYMALPNIVTDPEGYRVGNGYGSGDPGGGPVFDIGPIGVRDFGGERSLYGRIQAEGEYSQLDLMVLGKPYYDVCEWLRIVGTLGIVVSRGEFSLDETIIGSDFRRSRHADYSDWDVHGIAGLGLQFSYDDWTLGCDFYARFLDDPLEIDDSHVHGEIEQSDWLLKASLGRQF